MFTKESKQHAERIKGHLLPLLENAEKLGAKLQKAQKEHSKAHRVAVAWQYPTHNGYSEEAEKDTAEKARASGLIYYIGGLSDPVLQVWGKND